MSDALAFDSKSGGVSALLLNRDGTRTWQSVGMPSQRGLVPVGYADVDGDGQGDLLWRNAMTGANELWLMNGASHSVIPLPRQGVNFRVAALRDFTGDGHADVFFNDVRGGSSELWTLGAAGRTSVLPVDQGPAGMTLVAVADVDGDGAPDLIWHNLGSGAVEGWRMNGNTPVATFSLPSAPLRGSVAGAGDVDGDGVEDLVWFVRQSRALSANVWFMDGMNSPAQGVAVRIGKKVRVQGVTDVSGDGRADLVLASRLGFTAYRVDSRGTQNAAGEMEWSAQPIPLTQVPASTRLAFLVLQ
jgi:hypothetical protein